jgi:hypothetical protein
LRPAMPSAGNASRMSMCDLGHQRTLNCLRFRSLSRLFAPAPRTHRYMASFFPFATTHTREDILICPHQFMQHFIRLRLLIRFQCTVTILGTAPNRCTSRVATSDSLRIGSNVGFGSQADILTQLSPATALGWLSDMRPS